MHSVLIIMGLKEEAFMEMGLSRGSSVLIKDVL